MTYRRRVDQFRGAARAAGDATRAVTNVVEDMHYVLGAGPPLVGRLTRAMSAPAYRATRAVTTLVEHGVDAALETLAPVLDGPAIERGPLLAALNGVVGDYLERTNNALAIDMCLCAGGRRVEPTTDELSAAVPEPRRRLLVLVHGSSADESVWQRDGHDHGASLCEHAGFSALYLRYNSGQHVSTNGGLFAQLLERAVDAWPCPVDEVVLLCHSMGGLVARSACYAAERARLRWRSKLRALVTLGTPHHGAPLERAGAVFESLLVLNRYSAPLARLAMLRSAGVTDLRYGNVVEDDWSGRAQFGAGGDTRAILPLPVGVSCFAVAASTAASARPRTPGDGLVPVASALGHHKDERRRLAFPLAHQLVVFSTNHVDLLSSPKVFAALREWLAHDALPDAV